MTAPTRDQALPPLRIFWRKRFSETTLSWCIDLIPSREMTPAEREDFRRVAGVVAGMLGGAVSKEAPVP